MSVNVMIGILALLIALVLYSLGTWRSFRAKKVTRTNVIFLWLGVLFDTLATTMMAIENGGIAQDLHTAVAFTVYAGMIVAAALGSWALMKNNERLSVSVAKWTVVPWAAWVVMFLWAFAQRRG